ncbi:MAG: hypothetical protein AAB649_01190 [Patescibacteria group bacterium]
MKSIISLTGNMGVGKDTMADYMVAKYGYVKVSMADPFKRIAKDVYEFSDEQLWGPSEARNRDDMRYPRADGTFLSARIVTQLLGNELSRLAYPETWIVYMKRVVEKIQQGYFYSEKQGAYKVEGKKSEYSGIIVSSCRFKNEIEAIKEMSGKTVRLVRPALPVETFLGAGVGNHLSEKEQLALPDDFFDYVLEVPEGLENFHQKIDAFMGTISA